MRRVVPNGKKIAEIRKMSGKLLKVVASDVGVTERYIRYIEKENRPVEDDVLVKIARSLNVSPNEIKQNVSFDSPLYQTMFGLIKMRLAPVHTGGDLFRMAEISHKLFHHLQIDPTSATANIMEEILTIVQKVVGVEYWSHFKDGYEGHKFPDIHRIARLNELIPELNSAGINVLANNYGRKIWKESYDSQWSRETIMHVCLCPLDQVEFSVDVEPDDVAPSERSNPKQIDFNNADQIYSNGRYQDLDDDIPF